MRYLILSLALLLPAGLTYADEDQNETAAALSSVDAELVSAAIEVGRAEANAEHGRSVLILAQADTAPAAEADKPAAEDPGSSPATDAAPAEKTADAASAEEPAPDVGALITDAGKAIDDWRNVGWLAGVIALINLMLNLLRFTPVNSWLTNLDYKWAKPLTATLLGAALGGFSTYSTGASALNSIVAGAMAGLGSVGFHELMDKTRKRTTKPAAAKS